jgi:hypothetical protein
MSANPKSISREELLNLHKNVTEKARQVMTAKNQDYAHEGDVFRNFRYFGGLGILVRLSDKLARLRSFEENGTFAVADEKLEDTVIDAINYSLIYLAFKREGKPEKIQVKHGPECDNCDRMATLQAENGLVWCGQCAEQLQLNTNEMTLLCR